MHNIPSTLVQYVTCDEMGFVMNWDLLFRWVEMA